MEYPAVEGQNRDGEEGRSRKRPRSWFESAIEESAINFVPDPILHPEDSNKRATDNALVTDAVQFMKNYVPPRMQLQPNRALTLATGQTFVGPGPSRPIMYTNESSQYFFKLNSAFQAQLAAGNMARPYYPPPQDFLNTQWMNEERARMRKATNLPTFHPFHSPVTPITDFTENPLGPKWLNHACILSENDRLPLRQWESTQLGRLIGTNNDDRTVVGEGIRLTVMSYNVLSPLLLSAHSYLYGDCHPDALNWELRRQTFYDEVNFYRPDIICLQEIELSLWPEYDNYFSEAGYKGVFKKRTQDKSDGCAIFYRDVKFAMVESLAVEYYQPQVPILDRDNIGLLVKLKTRLGMNHQLVVGTTHLLYNPKRMDVKLAQTQLLLAELDRFCFSGVTPSGRPMYLPTVMTGDFNTEPHTVISKLMTQGSLRHVDNNGVTIKTLSRQGGNDILPPSIGISDQCQHYKVLAERLNIQRQKRTSKFELTLEATDRLVNLKLTEGKPMVSSRPSSAFAASSKSQRYVSTVRSDIVQSRWGELPAKNNIEQVARNVELSTNNEQILEEIQRAGILCTFGKGELTHAFSFRDVHEPKLNRQNTERIATTKQNVWICVDYIYYSMVHNERLGKVIEGNLKLIRRLGLLDRNQCKSIGSIPQQDIPSDHYPLIAEFLLKN